MIIVLWGNGLIGQAIANGLMQHKSDLYSKTIPFLWHNQTAQQQAMVAIGQFIDKFFSMGNHTDKPRLIFVWSAGQAGFSTTLTETDTEMSVFLFVLGFAKNLQQRQNSWVEFHLLSSAGGLFEGCHYVDSKTLPSPCRPYGKLKLNQEQELLKVSQLTPYIYRPSSVYGVPKQGGRSSLISVLLHHGILGQVISIVGTQTTLRDYVYVNDIGHYIAQKILFCAALNTTQQLFWMVSSKPSSILEITCMVEKIIRRQLYLTYKIVPDNDCDITFSPHLKPKDFNSSSLEIGIFQVYKQWKKN